MERPRILALLGGAVLLGQERGNTEALAALKEQGCEVLCLIRDELWNIDIPPALDARGLAWRKVAYIEHRMPGRLKWFLFRNPFAFIRANFQFLKIVRQYRPSHVHNCNALFALNFLIGLHLTKIPVIYRAGDEPTLHNWFWRLLWKFVVRRTDTFVANSQFVARSLINSGVESGRILVIHNTPPRRVRVAGSQPVPSLPCGNFLIVYVGQIMPHKGPHLLVEAFRRIAADYPSAHLVLVGRISDWEVDAWARFLRDDVAADPAISERVRFVGEVEDVPAVLAVSALQAVPSVFQDPSPNVVMEAKLAGVPSIVFPSGGLPELIAHNIDGYVCRSCTVEALAEGLRFYLERPDIAAQHGEAARASLERLEVSRFVELWMSVYSKPL